MRNFKHTAAAILAVVLIGSLAVSQAADMSAARAEKGTENNSELLVVTDVASEEATDVINIENEENQEDPEPFNTVKVGFTNTVLERAKPFEPVAGYVITTTAGLM